MSKNENLNVPLRALPISVLKGVGPVIAKKMAAKGLTSVEDLLYFVPLRWLDRSTIKTIAELKPGDECTVLASVDSYRSMFFRHARKKGFEMIVADETGFLSLKWFQWSKGYLQRICRKDATVFVSGKIAQFGDMLQIIHPDVAIVGSNEEPNAKARAVIPVYSQIEGIKQGFVRNIIAEAFIAGASSLVSVLPGELEERYGLVPLNDAMRYVHGIDGSIFSQEKADQCIRRMIMEEYLQFQITLMARKRKSRKEKGIAFKIDGHVHERFIGNLGFELTDAQKRVIGEIISDMARPMPMNRLLQGDVGSGKTVCAVAGACVAIDNGFQVAIMAPTEILAEQHYLNVHRWFRELGIPVVLLKGNLGKERARILGEVRSGAIPIVIGTHAIIQSDVEFPRLGLVIIDEQHRFGVEQRKKLKGKSHYPDVLNMTATPIPRTLSMVIYGDLDVSVIDTLPAGRQKITTRIFPEHERKKARDLVNKELDLRHGVFVVYPVIDESELEGVRDARSMAAHLQNSVFPDRVVGLLHGKMTTREKEDAMFAFRNGSIDILVCTTVIEVGIDVPRATVIVIENAERFGLSQLHQLRGRVGRGSTASKCVLLPSSKKTGLASRRLKIMEKTTDGFVIAEEDLRIRGVGDMLGIRQSGLPPFRIGDIVKDIDIMTAARQIAQDFTGSLSDARLGPLVDWIGNRFDDTRELSTVA
ncbi:MAG: ATP-dependent DNA helicase RecG [Syntrophorhabdaceae bacterium]